MLAKEVKEMMNQLTDDELNEPIQDIMIARFGILPEFWKTKDVKSVQPELTDDEAEDVLYQVENDFDANYGINWIVIGSAIETRGYKFDKVETEAK